MLLLTIAMYSIVFVIWGIIALFDFINDRWSKIQKVDISSKVHFSLTLLTISLALLYIYVRIDSKDYTEMMAAVVALFFSVYHLIRTIWGMTQLSFLRKWFCRSLYVMHNRGYDLLSERRLGHASRSMRKNAMEMRDENDHQNECATDIAAVDSFHSEMLKHLVNNVYLNNSIIDNELFDIENPIYLSFYKQNDKSKSHIYPQNPELCFLRWAVLYLSFYGVQFLQDSLFCRPLVLRRSGYFSGGDGTGIVRNYFVKALVTQAMLIGNGDDSRRTIDDQNQEPQEFEPTWETTWGVIVLARPEALHAAVYDSSCTPFGKMQMDIREGIYFERFARRITRLVDDLPPECFDHNVDDKDDEEDDNGNTTFREYYRPYLPHDDRSTNDNANVVKLVQGMSFVDVENFYIFLHSLPLHAVKDKRSPPIEQTQRELLSDVENDQSNIDYQSNDIQQRCSQNEVGTQPEIPRETLNRGADNESSLSVAINVSSSSFSVADNEPNFGIGGSRIRINQRVKYNYERIDSSHVLEHWRSREEEQEERQDRNELESEGQNQLNATDKLQKPKETLVSQFGFKKPSPEFPNTGSSTEIPIPKTSWAQLCTLPVFRRTKYLRPTKWNPDVFVISVVIDNIYATVTGNNYRQRLLQNDSEESIINGLQKMLIQYKKRNKDLTKISEEDSFK